ncbi:hypothetical protein [Pseudomonas sp. Root562]|uniref:hypothetical protein n=1 Tax=Pseudomonas sp. Root562 TaxID=1736561 RepID=UPI000A66B666|nr:hypothetical protein [Pseudomonas sp. Root562]
MKFIHSLKNDLGRYLVAICFAGVPLLVEAGSVEVTARFRPDPANPMVNRFENTTTNSGYCVYFAVYCKNNNLFSLGMPLGGLPQTTGGKVLANHTDRREGAYLKVPSEWRTLTVSNDEDTEQLEVRISGVGGRVDLNAHVEDLTGGQGWHQLWSGRSWSFAPAPCVSTTSVAGLSYYAMFMWRVPENVGACAKTALFDIPTLHYRYLHFGYELRTPNPLKMATGIYRGSITYSVGPGMDFDIGNVIVPHDSQITIDFVLSVEHILKVEIPPGGNRIELLPQGGWQAWLQRNRRPERLFRDQTFNISASSQFKMKLECQFTEGNTCALQEPVSGRNVPLNIAVSLPGGMADDSGQAVNRRPLLLDGMGTERFEPKFYIARKPGTLHFEIGRDEVEKMLDGDNKTYSGNVTVVWDSEV